MTGGTGSWGTAFAQEVLTYHDPARLTLYSRSEHQQVKAEALLKPLPFGQKLRMRLGDIRDYDRLRWALEDHEIVIHAAALKVIAHGLSNPSEMVRTNVGGTENVLRAAVEVGTQRVLTISSDKAASPGTLYGQTKALAEGLTVSWNVYGYPRGTWLSCVRWGNVLGSQGSVLHIFRHQVREGGPVTISDVRMTRYWITLKESVAFVLWVLARMRGGEVMIPVLPAAHVVDLARAVVLVECRDVQDFPFVFIGALPGEKLHEDLLTEAEAERAVVNGGGGFETVVLEPALLNWPRPAWEGAPAKPLRSDTARALTVAEITTMLKAIP